jgi:hypothetical protein
LGERASRAGRTGITGTQGRKASMLGGRAGIARIAAGIAARGSWQAHGRAGGRREAGAVYSRILIVSRDIKGGSFMLTCMCLRCI